MKRTLKLFVFFCVLFAMADLSAGTAWFDQRIEAVDYKLEVISDFPTDEKLEVLNLISVKLTSWIQEVGEMIEDGANLNLTAENLNSYNELSLIQSDLETRLEGVNSLIQDLN